MNPAEYTRMFTYEDEYWWFVGRHRLVEALVAQDYPACASKRPIILDAGCGTGAMSARLLRYGDVVSADFSPLALSFSRRRGLSHLVGADAMRLPLASCSFDAVVTMDVLEHLPDDRAALAEFYRILRPGGRVFATVPAYPHLWSEHDLALMHYRRYLRPELGTRFSEAGFTMEKLSHSMAALYPLVAVQRRLNGRRPPHDPPTAAMPLVPRPINAALIGLLSVENSLARRLSFPFGLSILAVARKA